METFGTILASTVDLMKVEFTVYGFNFSWWQVFIWTAFASLILWIIFSLWGGR